ncbi:unnamed protein product [Peniophora sp. CBMAI 1063]|nr:unnamed protein product [Peniophora sp. CBMAI 1063]
MDAAIAEVEACRLPDSASNPQGRLNRFVIGVEDSPINALPLDVLQEILCYLPFIRSSYTTHHHCNIDSHDDVGARDPRQDLDARRYLTGSATHELDDGALSDHQSLSPRLPRACTLSCVQIPWNWLEVMRVNRRWYRAAHQSPSFHSRIATQNIFAARRSVVLSQNEPVYIVDNFDTYLPTEERRAGVRFAIEMALSRAVDITLIIERKGFESFMSKLRPLFARPAPQLRRFQIHLLQSVTGQPTRTVVIPNDMFACHAPFIRSIDIDEASFDKACPLLHPALTSLILNGPALPWQTPAELCEALARLPLLEVLNVRYPRSAVEEPQPPPKPKQKGKPKGKKSKKKSAAAAPPPPPIPPPPPPAPVVPVTLEHLRQLTLEAGPNTIESFVENVHVPTSASLQIGLLIDRLSPIINWEDGPLGCVPTLYTNQLAAATASGSAYTQATITVEPVAAKHRTDQRSIVMAFSHPSQKEISLPGSMCFKVHWTDLGNGSEHEMTMIGIAVSVCEHIPSHLTRLNVIQDDTQASTYLGRDVDWKIYGNWWYDFLDEDAMKHVEELVLENRAAYDYAIYRWSGRVESRPRFEKLEQMIVRDFVCVDRTWVPDDWTGVDIHDYLSALVEYLPEDCHITFERCALDSKALKIIRKSVPEGKVHFTGCRTLISADFEVDREDEECEEGYYGDGFASLLPSYLD